MATNEKHQKNRKNITSKSSCFFTLIFLGFWSQLGWILASKLRPFPAIPLDTFSKLRPRGVQEAPKRLQERPKGVSRASNSLPRGPKECPKSDQNVPGVRPRCLQRVTFLRISLFFECFSAFSCVFLCFSAFFCVFLRRTPVNFSTLSSKLNCVRQQAKASKSKQKQAKGSQSKQEPARV